MESTNENNGLRLTLSANGMSPGELRQNLRQLSPEVGHVAAPPIDSASIEIAEVLVEGVKSLPALITAVAALWTAHTASKAANEDVTPRKLTGVTIETEDASLPITIDDLEFDSLKESALPEGRQVRQLRLNFTSE